MLFQQFARNETWHVPTLVQKRAWGHLQPTRLCQRPPRRLYARPGALGMGSHPPPGTASAWRTWASRSAGPTSPSINFSSAKT